VLICCWSTACRVSSAIPLAGDLGLPQATRRVPFGVARAAGAVLEMIWNTLGIKREPPMTRFLASVLARSHWYDIGPAARDFDYRPRVSLDEGRRIVVAWAKERARAQPHDLK